MKNEILTTCYQFIAAAVNGTYQGILITILVAASLRLLRQTNAATRYAVWFGTLLLLGLIIPAQFIRSGWDTRFDSETVKTPVSAAVSAPDPDEMQMEAITVPRVSEGESDYLAADANFDESDREFNTELASGRQNADIAMEAGTNGRSAEDPVHAMVLAILEGSAPDANDQSTAPETGFVAGIKEKLSWLRERVLTPLPPWKIASKTPLFVAALFPSLWLAIAGAKASLLVWQLFRIRGLKLSSVEPRADLNGLFFSLRRSLGVRRNVRLMVSMEHKSPVVLGFFTPVILLPADSSLETSEQVLRHELAHVQRCDDWANLVQHFVKGLFFFHPAIWWVSKRISLEREIACDDQVLQSTLRPKAYALLLADLAGRMQASFLAPGVSTNQSQLKQRIDMILNTNRNTSPGLSKVRLGLLATSIALLAVAAIYSAPRFAFAQSVDAAAPAAVLPEAGSYAGVASAAPAPALAVPEAAAIPVSSDAPSGLPAPPISPGPKFKPGNRVLVDVRPAITPRPSIAVGNAPAPALTPPAAMTLVAPPVPVGPIIASAAPYPEPGQPGAPRPVHRPGKDSSLEQRLDRLEKMVESLVAQKNNNRGQYGFSSKQAPNEMKLKSYPEAGMQWEHAQKDFARKQAELELKRAEMGKNLAELEKQRMKDPKFSGKIKELKELSEQHAKMAVDQEKIAEQAAREAGRAARDAQRGRTRHKMRDGSRQELEALHRHHQELEKQMENLERQIEKLEREQEQLDEQEENDGQEENVQQNQNNSTNELHSELSNNNASSAQPAAK